MKTDFRSLSITTGRSLFFYGTHEAYTLHRIQQFIDLVQKDKKVSVEWVDQKMLAAQPETLRHQPSLFAATASDHKIVVITDATDKSLKLIESHVLASKAPATIIVPALIGSSTRKLKLFHEKDKQSCFITCYLSSVSDKKQFLTDLTVSHGVNLDTEVFQTSMQLVDDDLEGLINAFVLLKHYVADQKTVTADDFEACMTSFKEADVNDVVFSITNRRLKPTLKAFSDARTRGAEDMHMLRGLLQHTMKLTVLKAKSDSGMNLHQAIQSMRPPIFFKHQDMFKRQADLWSTEDLGALLQILSEIELKIKTGSQLAPEQLWKPVFATCKSMG